MSKSKGKCEVTSLNAQLGPFGAIVYEGVKLHPEVGRIATRFVSLEDYNHLVSRYRELLNADQM